jgi:transposase
MGALNFLHEGTDQLRESVDNGLVRIEGERDIEQLRTKALVLLQENERLSKKMVELLKENLSLKGLSPEQLQQALHLIDEELNKTKAEAGPKSSSSERRGNGASAAERKPQTGHGPRAQPNLPVVPEVHELDEADQVCPSCGKQLKLWDGQDDETEEVDVVERHFVLKKHVRKKYRCQCGCVEMALMPNRLVPGGRYSNDFAIEVAVAKYVDHLPLERQVTQMEREGLVIDNQTLWDQVNALSRKLHPAWEELRADAMRQAVLCFDETRWEVLTKGSAAKKSWTMWQLSTRRGVYFTIGEDHDSAAGNVFLQGFKGIALGDAAVVHKAMAKKADYELAFCWAHGRRNFIAAESNDPIRSKQFLDMVGELFAIEAQAPPGTEGDELRRKLRNEKSRPVIERIRAWLPGQRFLPSSAIGLAIKYIARHWDGLCVFLDHPEVPIDNNRTERGFRGPAIGRHNFYGSHSKRGTEVAALFYSLIESAKLNGKEPKRYLKLALAAALDDQRIPLPHEIS